MIKPSVSVIKFSKQYLGNKFDSAKDISFQLYPNQIVGLIGHNGAGKSTLLKAMVGINHFTKGDILYGDISIKHSPVIAKEKFVFVGDRENVASKLTARQYFNFIGQIYNIEKKVLTAHILDLVKKYQFTQYLDLPIDTYSLGTKQKLSLIKAFLTSRDVILLDEPLNGLDPAITYTLKEHLKELRDNGYTILFSSHYIQVVENICDRVIIIKNGKIVDDTPTAAILEKYQNLETYYLSVTNN